MIYEFHEKPGTQEVPARVEFGIAGALRSY
jgi:hypothetical protein